MGSRRVAYLPLASIIVGIVILAVAVGAVSCRDITRGRRQVEDVLERQAASVARFLMADLHANLLGPGWQRDRLDLFFEKAGERREVAYVALIEGGGTVLAHSDREFVGTQWPADLMPPLPGPQPPDAPDLGPSARPSAGSFIRLDGRRVYQFAAALDATAAEMAALHHVRPPRGARRGPGHGMRRLVASTEPADVADRMSDLLGRPVQVDEPVRFVALVAFEASDLESAFLASRNHTLLIAFLLLAVGGTAIYFLFLMTGYRSAQTALANMRSYTANVMESMASGLVSVDAEGRVVTLNSRARELLGVEGSDATGRSLEDVVAIEPAAVGGAVADVVRGDRGVVESEAEFRMGDVRLPVSLSASSIFDEDARRSGAVVLFQDLREVEALKAEVERAKHLAAIGRLAAGVAHEVRNPLSSLKGFAQFLRGKFKPGSDEEHYSDIMIEEVERLDRVVQELLDFAKPVAATRKAVDPNAIVDESLALVSEDAGFRDVSIVRRLAEGLPDVIVDPFQIRQALLNLLLNAVEAMSGGGTLTVDTSVESDGGGAPHVGVSISDTGPGLSDDELDKLFEPFYTTKQRGTGLGLTIVSRLVEQNGGRVSVRSSPGEGTTFKVLLPTSEGGVAASADDAPTTSRTSPNAPGGGGDA